MSMVGPWNHCLVFGAFGHVYHDNVINNNLINDRLSLGLMSFRQFFNANHVIFTVPDRQISLFYD